MQLKRNVFAVTKCQKYDFILSRKNTYINNIKQGVYLLPQKLTINILSF